MKKNSSEHGFGHIGLILAVVGVVVIGGLVAWRFLSANKTQTVADKATESVAQQIAKAQCDYTDRDICKFFTSWKLHDSYKMTGTSADSETGQSSTYILMVSGKNTHTILTGELATEIITIDGKTNYTKAPDGTWWKQSSPENDPTTSSGTLEQKPSFEEPSTSDQKETSKTTYKLLGKEACGSLTCFKYQVVNPDNTGVNSELIWFDDKDYQLRRNVSVLGSTKNDTTFSYEKLTIKAPATFKELAPNQYLMPGSSEPSTIPTAN